MKTPQPTSGSLRTSCELPMKKDYWRLELVSIESLLPHPKFAGWHPMNSVTAHGMSEQIDKFGQTPASSVVVDTLMRVLDGYTHLNSLRKSGVTNVWVLVVDLTPEQQEDFVRGRHQYRRHYGDRDLMHYIDLVHIGLPRGHRPNGQPCPFEGPQDSELRPDEVRQPTTGEVADWFNMSATKVKNAIELKKSGDRHLINQVLGGHKKLNGAYTALKMAEKGSTEKVGWSPNHPIPVSAQELEALTKLANETGKSLEAVAAECITALLTHGSETQSVIPESTEMVVVAPAGIEMDRALAEEAPTPVPSTPTQNVIPAEPPGAGVAPQLEATESAKALIAQQERDRGPRSRNGLLSWTNEKKIIALTMLLAHALPDAIVEALGPNSEGQYVTEKSLEHMVRAQSLPYKLILTEYDIERYTTVINRLKASQKGTGASS